MVSKFKENDSEWTPPPKYLIGEDAFINNALSIECANDARIDSLEQSSNESIINSIDLPSDNSREQTHIENDKISIPVKITMDTNSINNKNYNDLTKIAEKERRSEEDKKIFINLLQDCVDCDEIDCVIHDKTGKLDLKNIELKDFRCYTFERKDYNSYRFKSYYNYYESGQSFMNNKVNHSKGQCEILVCINTFIQKNNDNGTSFKNPSWTWWLSYKY